MTAIHGPDEVAASCYRAWCAAASGGPPATPWEHLGLEHQAPWLRVALRGEGALLRCEGRGYAEAGAALAGLQCEGDGALLRMALAGPHGRAAYEALARHLMALLDGEGLADVGELERSWGPWAAARLPAALPCGDEAR